MVEKESWVGQKQYLSLDSILQQEDRKLLTFYHFCFSAILFYKVFYFSTLLSLLQETLKTINSIQERAEKKEGKANKINFSFCSVIMFH